MTRGWLTPTRRSDPELMDAPGLPEHEVAGAYETLRRVNRQLGNDRTIRLEALRFLREDEPGPVVSVLDVGSGSGDLPRGLAVVLGGPARRVVAIALDRDPTAARLAARGPSAPLVVRADALRLPMPGGSVDLVSAVKFAHHFEGPALSLLLAEMARVARRRVVVLDIRRHWLAFAGFVAWSRVFTRNRLVRHDGPLSVLRGFTPGELLDAARPLDDFAWTVRRYPGFQLCLVGRRSRAAGITPGRNPHRAVPVPPRR